jgi:alpha 1,2-mannosyltransferase
MGKLPIPYAGSIPYRKMCRYNSGFFYEHELLSTYDYYWRVEPSVKFFCNLDYDPFRLMKEGKKKYGFVVSLYEYRETVESLWKFTKGEEGYHFFTSSSPVCQQRPRMRRPFLTRLCCIEWMEKFPQYLAKPNMLDFISNDKGESYNMCHYWYDLQPLSHSPLLLLSCCP